MSDNGLRSIIKKYLKDNVVLWVRDVSPFGDNYSLKGKVYFLDKKKDCRPLLSMFVQQIFHLTEAEANTVCYVEPERGVTEIKHDKYYDFNGDCITQIIGSKRRESLSVTLNRSKHSSFIRTRPISALKLKDFSAVYRNKKHYHGMYEVVSQLNQPQESLSFEKKEKQI